jgi:sugar fermentation stimulation protein A
MRLPPMTSGRMVRRYKRFLADVELSDGILVTAHCANTGSMEGCWAPGAPVELSHSDNPRRKLAWTLERIDMGDGWIGVNTLRVNAIVAEGISLGRIKPLAGYRNIRSEPVMDFGSGRSRLDLLLAAADGDCLVEVKNATLLRDGVIQFPDAVTTRGRKHLDMLAHAAMLGYRACLVFAINRPESTRFRPADATDPAYASRLFEVMTQGVEVIVVKLVHGRQAIDAVEGWHWGVDDFNAAIPARN